MIIDDDTPNRFCPRCKTSGARTLFKGKFFHKRCLSNEEIRELKQ